MSVSFQTQLDLLAPPARLYDAWLSTATQTTITGAPAIVEPVVGGRFSLWGGSVRGQLVYLQRPSRIAQTWRTEDFGPRADDSRLELSFEPTARGTRLIITQDRIPPLLKSQFKYAWTEVYLPALVAWTLTPAA